MKSKKWIAGWVGIVIFVLLGLAGLIIFIDPYFHYHKPHTDTFFYSLSNPRSQNDGISRNFDYDAIITGSSMTENFSTSEFDELFGVNSVKMPFYGGTFKEVNDNLIVAFENNPNIKCIVRGLDYNRIFDDADFMRYDWGDIPTYLYDDDPFNDVKYIYNKDTIFSYVYSMISQRHSGTFEPGITSFDDYCSWRYDFCYGRNSVIPDGLNTTQADIIGIQSLNDVLSIEEKEIIYGNVTENITNLADEHPDVDFYYFFSPYSIAWWSDYVEDGSIYRQIAAEKYIIEIILEHKNIHLFSFNDQADITTDLNNYKDWGHYGYWINSLMLKYMKDGKCLLTQNNYLDYIYNELELYTSYDYLSLNVQEDYENDLYAAAILNEEITGQKPVYLLDGSDIELETSETRVYLDDLENHKYLVFYGKKIKDGGQMDVRVLDDSESCIYELLINGDELDSEWHQYLVDLSNTEGDITVVFNGNLADDLESSESEYMYRDVILY